ncbi:MAG: hypothetical protein QOJ91_552, partial [Sphingomonadales bacterium]|nr:hypothetical protein [Sphingomonadales bacterium]
MRKLTLLSNASTSVSSPEPDNPDENNRAGEIPKGIAGLFSAIQDEWDRAEEVIKLAEQVTAHAVIPSIQELRYAGRRLIDALHAYTSGEPIDRVLALLEDARFSCHRSRHDAIDAAISTMGIDSEAIARQMGYDIVHSSYPDYVNFLRRLDEVRRAIVTSRGRRSDRDEIYAAITAGDFPGLVQDYKDLRRSEVTMRIIAGRKKLGIWISLLAGVALALPGYVMSWYFWQYPRPAAEAP